MYNRRFFLASCSGELGAPDTRDMGRTSSCWCFGVCKGKKGQCEIETFPRGTKRSVYESNEISNKRNKTKQTKSPTKECFSNFQMFLIGSVKYLIDVGFKCCSYLQEPAVMFSEEYQVSRLDFFYTSLSKSSLCI